MTLCKLRYLKLNTLQYIALSSSLLFSHTTLSHSSHQHTDPQTPSTSASVVIKNKVTSEVEKNAAQEPETIQQARRLQSEHKFSESQKLLEAYINNRENRNSKHYYQANNLLSSVALIQGDYAAAKRSCLRLLSQSTGLYAANCSAAIGLISGKAEPTLKLLQQQIEYNKSNTRIPRSTLNWSYGLAAELSWSLGKPKQADHYFNIAIQQHNPAQKEYWTNTYLDFLISERRFDHALKLTNHGEISLAQNIRRAQAYKSMGNKVWKRLAQQLDQQYQAMGNDHPHWREAAMLSILLEKPQALSLATENWQYQKELIDAKLLLQAAIQHKNPDGAEPVIAWVNTQGIDDIATLKLLNEVQKKTTPITAQQ